VKANGNGNAAHAGNGRGNGHDMPAERSDKEERLPEASPPAA